MRVSALAACAAAFALSGCTDLVSSDSNEAVYALYRIGDDVLPAPSGVPGITVIGDTLIIPDAVVTNAGAALTDIRVTEDAQGTRTRDRQQYMATRRADALLVDNCPVGSFCIASLVYQPSAFVFVGDSLFEQVAETSQNKPRVYGRVAGGRPR
jgi:hypothetical protein